MPLRNIAIILVTAVVSLMCHEQAVHNWHARTVASAMELIERNYYKPVEEQPLFENAMHGLVRGLDRYSAFIPRREYDRFRQGIEQEFVGIGISVSGPPARKELTVITPIYGTPAYRAGIRAGDVITRIEGRSTVGMSLDEAIRLIKGPEGSRVRITVRRKGQTGELEFAVERARIQTQSVLGDSRAAAGRWRYYLADHPRIGYVRITTFGERTTGELKSALRFQNHPIDALILDVRGNAGGLLRTAVETCDMFLDHGTIVKIKHRDPRHDQVYRATPGMVVPADLPVVVLIDKLSASASEIVAACLKDHGRALLVGERTYGKGTVQKVFELESARSALKLTTAIYLRPNGNNIHRAKDAKEDDVWGVRPSPGGEVKLTDEEYAELYQARMQRDVLESEVPAEALELIDLQLQRAVELLEERMRPAENSRSDSEAGSTDRPAPTSERASQEKSRSDSRAGSTEKVSSP